MPFDVSIFAKLYSMSKEKTESKELAYILYMSGELQKNICSRVHVTPATLQKWMDAGQWKNKRSAKTITRPELVNRLLTTMSGILDRFQVDQEDTPDQTADLFSGLADKLVKISATIERLDKKNNVVNDVETFMAFHNYIKQQALNDPNITLEFIKQVNEYQDRYLKTRMSHE